MKISEIENTISPEDLTYETYLPTNAQTKAHRSPVRYKLYGGAMGGGKSVWLCAELIKLGLLYPNNQILLARFSYKDLKRTTLPIFLEMMPKQLIKKYSKTEGYMILKNGTQYYFADLEKPDKMKSLNLGAFGIDEATECPEDVFDMLTTRLRRNIPNIRYFGLLATNPEPGWIKDRWISEKKSGQYKYFPALPKDNPHLPDHYIEDMESNLPPIWRAKYLEGSWDAFDAQIFKPEWLRPSEDLSNTKFAFKLISIDPAITEKDLTKNHEPDYTAIVTLGVEYDTNLIHEIETVQGQWGNYSIIKNIEAAKDRHKPDIIVMEEGALMNGLEPQLRERDILCHPMKTDGDKVRRAIAVQSYFELGKVKVNNPSLSRQLMEFPNSTKKDMVDAMVHGVKYLKMMSDDSYRAKQQKYKGMDIYQINESRIRESIDDQDWQYY